MIFSEFTELCIIIINFRKFSAPPKEALYPLAVIPHFSWPSCPWPTTTNQFSISLDLLLWTFNIKGIIKRGPWWLALSLGIMLSRFIHLVTCASASFPLIAKWDSIARIYRVLLITQKFCWPWNLAVEWQCQLKSKVTSNPHRNTVERYPHILSFGGPLYALVCCINSVGKSFDFSKNFACIFDTKLSRKDYFVKHDIVQEHLFLIHLCKCSHLKPEILRFPSFAWTLKAYFIYFKYI